MKFNRNRLKSIYTHEISIYLHRHRTKKPFAQHIYSFRKISIQNACIYIYILYTIVPPEAKSHTLLKSNPDSIIYSKTIGGPRNPPMHPLFQPSAVSLPEKSQKHAVPQHPLNRAYILPHTHTRPCKKASTIVVGTTLTDRRCRHWSIFTSTLQQHAATKRA